MSNESSKPQHQQSPGQPKAAPGQQQRQGGQPGAGGQGAPQRPPSQGDKR